ncbi:antitoxin Phd family protein [Pelobacter seleniigenes]|uniref:antitoxin Phd family protein n=1 Tax=Pelobacter seleniigenes TaxID=407188 RepID=UPI0004A7144D|nr:antitoxin Phd family protein [Pelobacter seleniigenes]
MKLSSQNTPISYLKAAIGKNERNQAKQGAPLVIAQNGEAKVVLQTMESCEQTQGNMVLMKILALGMRQIKEGKYQPAGDVVMKLRARSTNI